MSKSKQFFAGYEPNELSTTIDQWREALAATSKPKYPDGKTLAELAAELGVNRRTLKDRLVKAADAGTCRVYKDYRNNRLTTVYVLEK